VSTRSAPRTRARDGVWPAYGRRASGLDPAEEVALVAHSARALLLSAYRAWLRQDDLEDCHSQATLELIAQARRGELRYSSRAHLRSLFQLRFVSRVRDRRRALRGRSPAQAMLDGALSQPGGDGRAVEVADPRADVERRMLLRHELRALQRAAHDLSPDQRLVLACQIGLQMSAREFCATFGWSHEKRRKVAQRARARLRRLSGESIVLAAAAAAGNASAAAQPADGNGGRAAGQGAFEHECPVRAGQSGEKVGTLL
jgi:DNA-directed RNA polymerase specialized sigma24 family protein